MSEWLDRFRELTRDDPRFTPGAKRAKNVKILTLDSEQQDNTRDAEDFGSFGIFGTGYQENHQPTAVPSRKIEFDWHLAFVDRCAAYRLRGRDPTAIARLAWSDLQSRWHFDHGDRVPPDRCAGCHQPLAHGPVLDLIDGCRVHAVDTDCLIAYGVRWRAAAREALIALGLEPIEDDAD
jgi:hypothetical protein